MRKHLHYLITALFLASLLLAACAPAAPAPTPTPTAKPAAGAAPTPASKPAAEPTPASGATPTVAAKPAAAGAPAKTYNWKLTSVDPPGYSLNRSLHQFAKLLDERTNGAVKITVYESTLGGPGDHWDMVKSNTIQLAFTGEGHNPGRMPVTSLINLPFEIPDAKALGLVLNEWLKTGYLKELTDNFKVLYFRPLYPLNFFFRNKKIATMDDFKGLKIRSVSGLQGQLPTSLGSAAVSVAPGDVYMALDRGVIDGAMTGIDNAVDRKFYEVAKYAPKLPLACGSKVLVMNKDVWNSLSPDLQATIDKTSQEVIEADLKIAEADEKSLWEVYGKNAEVYAISQEEQKRWRDAAAGVADKYVEETVAKGYPAKEALSLMRRVVSEYKK